MINLKFTSVAFLAIFASLVYGGEAAGTGENGSPEENSAEAQRRAPRQATPEEQAAIQEMRDTAASLSARFTILKHAVDNVVIGGNAVVDRVIQIAAKAGSVDGLKPDVAVLRIESDRVRNLLNVSLPSKIAGLSEQQQNFQDLAVTIATTHVSEETVLQRLARFTEHYADLSMDANTCKADVFKLLESAQALEARLPLPSSAPVSRKKK